MIRWLSKHNRETQHGKAVMRQEKQSIIDEIRAGLTESSFVLLVEYRGMKAAQANELRGKLLGENARMQVVKNSLFKRAVDESMRDGVSGFVSGPMAMVVGRGDLTAVARLLKAFQKDNELPALKMGVWQGEILSAEDLDALVNLPPKPVLHGMVAGLLAAPLARLAGVLNNRLSSVVYVLKAAEEKKRAAG